MQWSSYHLIKNMKFSPANLRPGQEMLSGAGLRQVRGRAKGFWAAKVLSVSAKAGSLIWHRHFNVKKVIHELKRASDEVPCGLLQGPHAALLAVQCEAEHCLHDVLHCRTSADQARRG